MAGRDVCETKRCAIHRGCSFVNCHPVITSVDELTARIDPESAMHLDDRSDTIEIRYSLADEPERRGYFITLRNWVISEVCSAD